MDGRLASKVDRSPTILDRLGGDVPSAMDGASLLPARDGAPQGGHAAVLPGTDLAHPRAPPRMQRALGLCATPRNAAVLRKGRVILAHLNGGLPPRPFDRRPIRTGGRTSPPPARTRWRACARSCSTSG